MIAERPSESAVLVACLPEIKERVLLTSIMAVVLADERPPNVGQLVALTIARTQELRLNYTKIGAPRASFDRILDFLHHREPALSFAHHLSQLVA